jgi:transposase-like protein
MRAFYYDYEGVREMRRPRVEASEQYRLIMECRQSGLSDYQWCKEKGIRAGTFYNWVNRLRQKGVPDIPKPAGQTTYKASPKQEVVRIDIERESPPMYSTSQTSLVLNNGQAIGGLTIEIEVNGNRIGMTNDVAPELLSEILQILIKPRC